MINRQPFLFEAGVRYEGDMPIAVVSSLLGAEAESKYPAMPEIKPASSSGVDVTQKAVMLSVEFRSLGVRRSLAVGEGVAVQGTDPRLLRATKILLESKAFDKIKKADGKMRAWIEDRSLPSMFRRGVYLVPVGLVADVYEKLEVFRRERNELVGEFEREYSASVSDARVRLGSLFRVRDYPDSESMVRVFGIAYQFIEIGAPGSLASISAALFEQEKDKAAALWTNAAEQAISILRNEMSDLVDHLVERLTPDATGKRKEFKAGTVENLREWLSLVEARNITGDAELGELAKRARALLSGRSPDTLRKDMLSRERVRDGMQQIKARLDTLVSVMPSRRVVVDSGSEDVEL